MNIESSSFKWNARSKVFHYHVQSFSLHLSIDSSKTRALLFGAQAPLTPFEACMKKQLLCLRQAFRVFAPALQRHLNHRSPICSNPYPSFWRESLSYHLMISRVWGIVSWFSLWWREFPWKTHAQTSDISNDFPKSFWKAHLIAQWSFQTQ